MEAETTQAVSSLNVWIPVISGLAGAAIGGLTSYAATVATENRRLVQRSNAITSALLTEITALISISEGRNYLGVMGEVIRDLSTKPEGSTAKLTVLVPEHYSRIYQANAKDIGLLIDIRVASSIVTFYQMLDTVVQDVIPGGLLSTGAPIQSFNENYNLLSQALILGKNLTESTVK